MISLLDPDNPAAPFPPVHQAEREPDGLLAVGGDLKPARLINAYRHGIFPWFSEDQPILWWSPDPRTILVPGQLKISRSLRQSLRNRGYRISFDRAFADTIDHCSMTGPGREETWITDEMKQAYQRMYHLGYAHSVEVWHSATQVGGLYGIAIGRVFFGESMFSRARDASKVALVHLCQLLAGKGFELIDCQVNTSHLMSLGAREIDRSAFCELLDVYCEQPGLNGSWRHYSSDQPAV